MLRFWPFAGSGHENTIKYVQTAQRIGSMIEHFLWLIFLRRLPPLQALLDHIGDAVVDPTVISSWGAPCANRMNSEMQNISAWFRKDKLPMKATGRQQVFKITNKTNLIGPSAYSELETNLFRAPSRVKLQHNSLWTCIRSSNAFC